MKTADYDKITAGLDGHVVVRRETITDCMMNQAELYTYYAIAYHRAVRDVKLLAFQVEAREAEIDRDLQQRQTKVTVKDVATACHADKRWVDLRNDQVEAEDSRDALESVLRAMEHRRDMLVNLGATVREEMRSADVHINKRSSRHGD